MVFDTHLLHDLLQRGREADQRAWAEFFDWVEQRLEWHARKMLRTRFADMKRWMTEGDIKAEVRTRLWKYLKNPKHTPENMRHFWGTLARIVQRTMVDYVDTLKTGKGFARNYQSHTDEGGSESTSQIEQLARQTPEGVYLEVIDAMSTMPRELREATRLHVMLGMTVAQIATAMGWSVGTTSTRINEGKAILRRLLE
jgi:RNA polymerase sigma factor (sigma-70 family)